jgi:urease accessory protein UreF
MTQSQLSEWLKQQIKNQNLKLDFSQLKKAFEGLEVADLDRARLTRSLAYIDQLTLSLDQLEKLAKASSNLGQLYVASIEKYKEEIKADLIYPLEEEKDQLTSEIIILTKSITKSKQQESLLTTKVEHLEKQIQFIIDNKTRLIEDIKINSQVIGEQGSHSVLTFEEQIFINDKESFSGIDAFVSTFATAFQGDEQKARIFSHTAIFQLKTYKALLANRIEPIQVLAKLTGNCKLFIQQAEPDWIKFELFYQKSIMPIWTSAYKHPDTIHFLILEDINIASIECYGRPLLDIINGIRKTLPGLNSEWPKNLWIFGIPIDLEGEQEFGIPLYKKTFSNWGAFPKILSDITIAEVPANNRLVLEEIFKHNTIVSSSLIEYLS